MKLSVIIPFYNEAIFLGRCIRSLQPREEVEYILIDDGSADGSLDTCRACVQSLARLNNYHADHFKIMRFRFNYGVSFARNAGITEAKGDFITFLDADDTLAPGGIDNMLKVLYENNLANAIQFNHYRMGEDDKARIVPKYAVKNANYSLKDLPPKWAPVWNKCYNRAFIQTEGISFPVGQQFDEDRNFNLQCLRHAGGLRCNEAAGIIKHFDNEASLCHTFDRKKATDALHALVKFLEEPQAPEFEKVVMDSLFMHLNSKRFKNELGGQT